MTIEPFHRIQDHGGRPGNYFTGNGPVPPITVPESLPNHRPHPVDHGPVPPIVVHPVPVTTDTDDHTPARVVNSKPWEPQQNAAYARMAAQLLTALGIYRQETADAGRLLEVPGRLAARVRAEIESAAWAAWQSHMNAALAAAPAIISPALHERDRGLTGAYSMMMAAVADAWSEWHRWMELAASATEAIMEPAQKAYDHRMEQAYLTMTAANNDAEDSWKRMYDGAERAGTLLTSFDSRAGYPPPA